MKTLRAVVGELIGQQIDKDNWDETFTELNLHGWIDTKISQQIILALCKKVDELEQKLEKLTPAN